MNWLNIHTDILRSEEFLGAEPIERATWLNLLGWCATQENGGIIINAKQWKDRKWQQVCGVTLQEVELASELYRFIGNNLEVKHYPLEAECAVMAKREAGKKGGRPPKTNKKTSKEPYGFENKNHVDQVSKREVKTKGKERKGNEREVLHDGGEPNVVMGDLKAKINSLRPEWETPKQWGYAEEQHLFNGAAAQMAELADRDWIDIRRFFKAFLDNSKAYWRPYSRGKFVETFPDVWASCQRWRLKNKPPISKPKPPEPVGIQKPDWKEYETELVDYINTKCLDKTGAEIAEDREQWADFIHWLMKTAD